MASELFQNALIYLGTAVVCVPISKKLGIGSVLGYLIGGILVGPFVLGLIGNEGHDVMHTAEFGVVMMLFVIGLELNPVQFWRMRNKIAGLGGLQMLGTALLLGPLLYFILGFTLQGTLALALTFAMSSTAIVLQTLKEKGLDKTHAGQYSFSVLLFQDIAVIPILAILPLLAIGTTIDNEAEPRFPDYLWILNEYPSILLVLAVGFVFVLSRYILPRVLHWIAKVNMHELFTTAALFFVIGIAWLMEQAGISAALGAFMAGVLLANSEFRHELEADISPFKGLLLGIFFTAVGSTINFDIIAQEPLQLTLVVLSIMFVKWVVLWGIGSRFKMANDQRVLFAFLLCQIGEFAFVLLGAIGKLNVLPKGELDFFMAVITLSMMCSPLLLFINEKWIATRLTPVKPDAPKAYDEINEHHKVILVGFGHFGSTVGRFLRANHVEATIIDNDSDQVNLLRRMGFKVYYGNGTRLDILESAGAHTADILILATNNPADNTHVAELVAKHFPKLKLFVRAKNRYDAYELMDLGVEHIHRESLHDSVFMAVDVLASMGHRKHTLHRKAQNFIKYDHEALRKLHQHMGTEAYIDQVRAEIELQEQLLKADTQFIEQSDDSAWDSESTLHEN